MLAAASSLRGRLPAAQFDMTSGRGCDDSRLPTTSCTDLIPNFALPGGRAFEYTRPEARRWPAAQMRPRPGMASVCRDLRPVFAAGASSESSCSLGPWGPVRSSELMTSSERKHENREHESDQRYDHIPERVHDDSGHPCDLFELALNLARDAVDCLTKPGPVSIVRRAL